MKLILCGGGSGDKNIIANKKLNQIINHDKKILYVPLAMDEAEHPYDGCYNWICDELSKVNHSGIEMVRSFEKLANKNYNDYSCIFIGGGNTYKLLKGLKDSGSFEKINEYLNNGGIIIGGSAGAVIFGQDIDIIKQLDPNDVSLQETSGFNKFNNVSIFPHYTNYRSKFTEEENKERMDKFSKYIIDYSLNVGKVYAIPEEDAIYVDDDNFEVIGTLPYYIAENGILTKYEIEEKVEKSDKNILLK